MKEDKKYHIGHRKRLRNRYIENGIDALAEHEILELLLFYAMPRIDTKPMAHRLIDEYGSLESVLNASFDSLKKHGFTDTAAVLVKLHYDIESWMEKNKIAGKTVDDYNKAGHLAVQEFDGAATEKLIMLMLDSGDKVLGISTVCEGGFSNTAVNMRSIVEVCFEKKAAKVILAHNHPSGDIRPSAEDYVTTSAIENLLSGVGIELAEHYVVADGTFFGIKHHCNI